MKRFLLFMMVVAMMTSGCAHSFADKNEQEKTINAPIATVWEATKYILPKNNIDIDYENKERWFMKAGKAVSAFDWGQNMELQYFKKDETHTIAEFQAKAHYGRTPNIIDRLFNQIKAESERMVSEGKRSVVVLPETIERAKKCQLKGGIWVNDICQLPIE